jgi:hypothetical protein
MNKKIRKVTKKWKTKSGIKIRICDMTDAHLNNTINFLCNKALEDVNTIPYPCFQGEMAQHFAEQEFETMQNATPEELAVYVYPIYTYLIREQDRRKQLNESDNKHL